MRWTRRLRLPKDVRAGLAFEPGERVLAVALASDQSWVVATDRAVLATGQRLDWTGVAHAEWDDGASTLTIEAMPVATAARSAPWRLVLERPELVPETVRERVSASVVASRHVRVRGGAGVRVIARRVPGSPDLLWQVAPDRGIDLADPVVALASRTALAELQVELGG